MAVGKEALRTLEKYARQQRQIYDDACDVGIPASPKVRDEIRDALKELKELEGGEAGKGYRYTTYRTRLAFEMDEGRVQGVSVLVTRHEAPRRALDVLTTEHGYFTVEIWRDSWTPGATYTHSDLDSMRACKTA